jgi:hypothetical protein
VFVIHSPLELLPFKLRLRGIAQPSRMIDDLLISSDHESIEHDASLGQIPTAARLN